MKHEDFMFTRTEPITREPEFEYVYVEDFFLENLPEEPDEPKDLRGVVEVDLNDCLIELT